MTPSRHSLNVSAECFAASDIDRDQGLSRLLIRFNLNYFPAFEDLVLNSDGVSDGAPRCVARAAFFDSTCPWRRSRQCDSADGSLVRYCEVLFWQQLLPYHPTETIFMHCMPCIVSVHRVTLRCLLKPLQYLMWNAALMHVQDMLLYGLQKAP